MRKRDCCESTTKYFNLLLVCRTLQYAFEAVGNTEWVLNAKSETILLETNLASSKLVTFYVGALGNMPSATVKKRFAQSDESQADGEKGRLFFPRGDVPLTTNHLIDTLTPVSHYFLALPSVLHTTKPAHLT